MAEFWKRDRGGVVELQYQFIFGVYPGRELVALGGGKGPMSVTEYCWCQLVMTACMVRFVWLEEHTSLSDDIIRSHDRIKYDDGIRCLLL